MQGGVAALQLSLLMALLTAVVTTTPAQFSPQEHLLSRSKRYVTFPEGSSVTFLVCCNSVGPFADSIFTFGLDVDMSFELPNDTRVFHPHHAPYELRRERRDVYLKLENLFSAAGMDGRACVLKTLCEVSQRLEPNGGMVEELLRILFTLPRAEVMREDDFRHHHYDSANHLGRHGARECKHLYPECGISLLDLVLGY